MPLAVAIRMMADFHAVRNMEVIVMFRDSYESRACPELPDVEILTRDCAVRCAEEDTRGDG